MSPFCRLSCSAAGKQRSETKQRIPADPPLPPILTLTLPCSNISQWIDRHALFRAAPQTGAADGFIDGNLWSSLGAFGCPCIEQFLAHTKRRISSEIRRLIYCRVDPFRPAEPVSPAKFVRVPMAPPEHSPFLSAPCPSETSFDRSHHGGGSDAD